MTYADDLREARELLGVVRNYCRENVSGEGAGALVVVVDKALAKLPDPEAVETYDEMQNQIDAWIQRVEELDDASKLEDERNQARQQRDELAAALEKAHPAHPPGTVPCLWCALLKRHEEKP